MFKRNKLRKLGVIIYIYIYIYIYIARYICRTTITIKGLAKYKLEYIWKWSLDVQDNLLKVFYCTTPAFQLFVPAYYPQYIWPYSSSSVKLGYNLLHMKLRRRRQFVARNFLLACISKLLEIASGKKLEFGDFKGDSCKTRKWIHWN